MLRKSLILGSITLLMVMLFAFTGCEGPVGPAGTPGVKGDNADDGKDGEDYYSSGASWAGPLVRASDLEAAFKYTNGNIVILQTSVDEVYGEVPAGKTLHVLGSNTRVSPGQTLTINGTLDILEKTATLTASGIPDHSGSLKVGRPEAKIQGEGAVILPYVFSGTYEGGLNYGSPEVQGVADRYPGSAFSIPGETPDFLSSSNIAEIFYRENLDKLTVQDIHGLTTGAIPANKSLVLKGIDNEIGANFNLGGFSRLTIEENAILTVKGGATELSTSVDGVITNRGTIRLEEAGAKISAGNTTFINDGVIESPATLNDTVQPLINLEGAGTIKLIPSVAGDIDFESAVPSLRQNLIIAPDEVVVILKLHSSEPLPLGGVDHGKIITLANEYAKIQLAASSVGIGAAVVNKGEISTATTDPNVLATLFSEMNNKGLVKGSGILVSLTKPFEIPAGVSLELSGVGTTFGSSGNGYDVTIGGSLTLTAAVQLSPENNVTVSGALSLGSGSLTTSGNVTITGTLNTGTGGGDGLVVTGLGILAIPSRGITGTSLIKAAGRVTVDNVPGYGITSTGVAGGAVEDAVSNTSKARDALRRTATLDPSSEYNSSSVAFDAVGRANVAVASPSWAAKVIYRDAATTPVVVSELLVDFPSSVTVLANGIDDRGHAVAGSNVASWSANDFSVYVKDEVVDMVTKQVLGIRDNTSPTGSAIGVVVEFNSVRFVDSELIGPVVDTFYVGIRALR
jgi:hypothetical protein